MARLEPLNSENAPEGARGALRGAIQVSAGIKAYWPPLLEGEAAMDQALRKDRLLPETLLRIVKLRTAQIIGCPF
ncbi:MAG: hypothetical protein ACRDFS_00755 [Chloroflexota bacterium]